MRLTPKLSGPATKASPQTHKTHQSPAPARGQTDSHTGSRSYPAPRRTDRPTGLEIRGAWNDHARGRNNGRRRGTTQYGTDRVGLQRPRACLEGSDTDGSRQRVHLAV